MNASNQTTMSHEQAISTKAAERYLLGELETGELEAFEAHYFDCPACFEQIEMGAQFLGRAREVLDPEQEKGWLSRMIGDLTRPAPAFVTAMLLCAVALGVYQQTELAGARGPQLAAHYVLAPARGGESAAKVLQAPRNGWLSLSLDFNPQSQFSSYRAQIVSNSTNKVKLEFAVLPPAPDSSSAITFQTNKLEAGKYRVVIFGVTPDGASKEIGQNAFDLRFSEQRSE
jgi:hypothetical protein